MNCAIHHDQEGIYYSTEDEVIGFFCNTCVAALIKESEEWREKLISVDYVRARSYKRRWAR
jgi:hypothetical protein